MWPNLQFPEEISEEIFSLLKKSLMENFIFCAVGKSKYLSKLAQSIEGKAMSKYTFFIMNKIRRLFLIENTPICSKFSLALWANKRLTFSSFSYVKNKQTISASWTMLTCTSISQGCKISPFTAAPRLV